MSPKRVLVVANRTVDSPDLVAALRRRHARGAVSIVLLVPAVPHGLAWAADMKAGIGEASDRADAGARRMRAAGLTIDEVVVGDPDPLAAAGDLLHHGGFDEVVVSTLPRGISRWLRLSLPDRLRRTVDLPVTHVVAHPRARQAAARRRAAAAA